MSIVAVFEKTQPIIVAAVQRAGFKKPWIELGEEHLPRPRHMPAILWIPVGGPIIASRQMGPIGAVRAGDAVVLREKTNPQHYGTRNERIRCLLMAGTFRQTEEFLNTVHAILTEHMTDWSFRAQTTEWSTGWPVEFEEPQKEWNTGTLCILGFDLSIPLTAEKRKTAEAETATITSEVDE